MKKLIITPAYYISPELEESIRSHDDKVVVIITDDVSPIFPLETRMHWLSMTIQDVDFEIDSIFRNDEMEDFLEELPNVVKKHRVEGEEVIIEYHFTESGVEKFGEITKDFKTIKSPLEVTTSDFSEMFCYRFELDFFVLTKPKNKNLPTVEPLNAIPYFVDGDTVYYGFVYLYGVKELTTIELEAPYKARVAETNALLSGYVSRFVDAKTLSNKMIGWLQGAGSYYLVEVEKPVWFKKDAVRGIRRVVSLEADMVFFDKTFMKQVDNPIVSWVYTKIEDDKAVVEKAPANNPKGFLA